MRRLAMILGAALCVSAPAGAQSALQEGGLAGTPAQARPAGSVWQIDGGRDNAYVYDSDLSAALAVSCYEDDQVDYFLQFGVPNRFGPDTTLTDGRRSGLLADAFKGVSIMVVETRDASGTVTSSIRLTPRTGSGSTVWQADLTPAELRSIRTAARLDARSNRWAVAFTGSGSSRRIGEVSCHQE